MSGMAWAGRLGIVIALIIIEKASPALAWLLVIVAGVAAVCVFLYRGEYLPKPIVDLIEKLWKPKEPPKTPTVIDASELADYVKARVIGQDTVVDALANRLRQRLAARRPNRAVAVMCFAGAPGVGKTHLAKMLTEKLYGRGDHLHFFDMTKYQQSYSATTLFGVPAGHVGSHDLGLIGRALRDKPNSIILLDEFEKAHRDVHTQFLTAWNDGFVTDQSNGVKFSTAETIFILTTNAGAQRIVEQARDPNITQEDLNKMARSTLTDAQFAPEVLSRIDDVFAFRELEGLDVARVVALEMEAKAKEYQLEIAEHGIDPVILIDATETFTERKPKGGVREIARRIEEKIADGLIEAQLSGAKEVRFEADGERIRVIPVEDGVPQKRPAPIEVRHATVG